MFGIYADWDTLNAKYDKIVKKWKTSIIVIIFYVFFKHLLRRTIYWWLGNLSY